MKTTTSKEIMTGNYKLSIQLSRKNDKFKTCDFAIFNEDQTQMFAGFDVCKKSSVIADPLIFLFDNFHLLGKVFTEVDISNLLQEWSISPVKSSELYVLDFITPIKNDISRQELTKELQDVNIDVVKTKRKM